MDRTDRTPFATGPECADPFSAGVNIHVS